MSIWKWKDATPKERRALCNGIGPSYFPKSIRDWITNRASYFFREADWCHHDWGYHWGVTPKWECDKKFLQAMLRDASRCDTVVSIFTATLLAYFFWFMVTLFGGSAYNSKGLTMYAERAEDPGLLKRAEFPSSVKKEAFKRAEGKCEKCGANVSSGAEYDHIIPAVLGGGVGIENCQVLCKQCHIEKTAADRKAIAKVKRLAAKKLGVTKRKRKIPSRPLRSKQNRAEESKDAGENQEGG